MQPIMPQDYCCSCCHGAPCECPCHNQPTPNGDWIEQAARGIVSRWMQWEWDAGKRTTNRDDYLAYLEACLANYLRWMQANHGKAVQP